MARLINWFSCWSTYDYNNTWQPVNTLQYGFRIRQKRNDFSKK